MRLNIKGMWAMVITGYLYLDFDCGVFKSHESHPVGVGYKINLVDTASIF